MVFREKIKGSSLIDEVIYDSESKIITIFFIRYYVDKLEYIDVPFEVFLDFIQATSLGKFYLSKIKPIYKQFKNQIMPSDRVLKIKINTRDINKEWLFIGEKGTYLNATLFLNNEDNPGTGLCGTIIQDVPKNIYEDEKHLPKDQRTQGVIIGNTKQFKKAGVPDEAKAGSEGGRQVSAHDDLDDLPF